MIKIRALLLPAAIVPLLAPRAASGQGCVAIRSFASCNPNAFTNSALHGKGFTLTTNYRYFKSFRHFVGTEEQPQRFSVVNPDGSIGNEVINYVTQLNVGLTYDLNSRSAITVVLPWTYNVRSSLYEHGSWAALRQRHNMRSAGIGDVRVSFNHWIFNPDSVSKGNLAVGAGIKLPTGNFNARAFACNVGPDVNGDSIPDGEYRPVDQSIQLGDGGFGFTLELQGYMKLFGPVSGYLNAFYLFNPGETNDTRTYRETLSAALKNESICSIPDQYMVRAGLNWTISKKAGLNLFAGGRLEGIPVKDVLGKSGGFRRPGYVLSLEPGMDWMKGRHDINVSVPWALQRNRAISVTDKEMNRKGDAAFADYLINVSWSVRLAKAN